jgi:hypothetical protein
MSKCWRESGGDKFSKILDFLLSVQLLIVCCVIPANAGYSLPMISAMAPPFLVYSRATLCLASPSKQLARPSKISRRFARYLCVGPWFLLSMGRRGRRIDLPHGYRRPRLSP